MPTGQGVNVTVACDPLVSELEMVCVQFSDVVAYAIPTGLPSPHHRCLEPSVRQEDALGTWEPDWLEGTTPFTGLTTPALGAEARPPISNDSKSTAKATGRIATTPFSPQ
jgi:hypothetical protein